MSLPQPGSVTSESLHYEGYPKRVLAFLIDAVALFLCMFLVIWVFGFLLRLWLMLFSDPVPPNLQSDVFSLYSLYGFFFVVLCFLFESSSMQATPGKFFLGLRVCNVDGKRLSPWHVFCRNFVKFGCFPKIFQPIGGMFAIWTKKKQALHDLAARTLVVRRPN